MTTATAFSTLCASLPYGWHLVYELHIEGIPYIFGEQAMADAPSGYTKVEALVIDESARVGVVVDEREGIGRGFDLTVMLRRNATTEALFTRPSFITDLTADLAWDETTSFEVTSTSGAADPGTVYIGREAITTTTTDGDTFAITQRGAPNGDWRAYDHDGDSAISTWVTDVPLFWRGREARLYARAVDPFGGDDADTHALVSVGHVWDQPQPTADGWELQIRAYDRMLTDKVGVTVSGTGKWEFDGDPLVELDSEWGIHIEVYYTTHYGSAAPDWRADLRPWSVSAAAAGTGGTYAGAGRATGDLVRLSILRQELAGEYATQAAADGDANIGDVMVWRKDTSYSTGTPSKIWRAAIGIKSATNGHAAVSAFVGNGTDSDMFHAFGVGDVDPSQHNAFNWNQGVVSKTLLSWFETPIYASCAAHLGTLSVTIDDGDPNDLPTAGHVIIEIEDHQLVYEYENLDVAGNVAKIRVVPGSGPPLSAWAGSLFQDNEIAEVSVTFAFVDGPDTPADNMRRLLMSSGRGDNDGTYDTEVAAQGLDLARVDTASFDNVLDAGWQNMQQTLLIDDEVSFADLWGGMLALWQRAIVMRPDGAGDMELTCIRTTLNDTADTSVTLSDTYILGGGRPVRPVRRPRAPSTIDLKLKSQKGEDAGSIKFVDRVLQKQCGTSSWSIDTYGISRAVIGTRARYAAQSYFLETQDVTLWEFDVVPWFAADVGDTIQVDSSHFALWDKSTGARGYSGPGKILGWQLDLKTYAVTLTVALAGTYLPYSLSPSAVIEAYAGAAGNPTSIDIDLAYLSLMQAYLASSNPFTLVYYTPSEDDASTDGYTISAVASAGGYCRLTVASVIGSPSITASLDYLTLPAGGTNNTAQKLHMHTSTPGAVWR